MKKEKGNCLSTQKRGQREREIMGHDGLWVATVIKYGPLNSCHIIISIHCACLQESITTESVDCGYSLMEGEDAVSHVT